MKLNLDKAYRFNSQSGAEANGQSQSAALGDPQASKIRAGGELVAAECSEERRLRSEGAQVDKAACHKYNEANCKNYDRLSTAVRHLK